MLGWLSGVPVIMDMYSCNSASLLQFCLSFTLAWTTFFPRAPACLSGGKKCAFWLANQSIFPIFCGELR